MKTFPIAVGSAALGLALLAGATRTVVAADQTAIPPDNAKCYYHLWTCSYDGNGYWSNCDPQYGEGMIDTATARGMCTNYHAS